jgi:hypothetical protein
MSPSLARVKRRVHRHHFVLVSSLAAEYTVDSAGDRESDFENGNIEWIKAAGQTLVYQVLASRCLSIEDRLRTV